MVPQPCHLPPPRWSPSVMMGVNDLQASGETRLPGRHIELFWEGPQTPPSPVCSTDDCALFLVPSQAGDWCNPSAVGASLPGSSGKTPECSLRPSQKGRGWLGCSWQRPVKGVAGMAKNLRHFCKGRRHSSLRALQTLRVQTRGGALPRRTPQTLQPQARGYGLSATEFRELSR